VLNNDYTMLDAALL